MTKIECNKLDNPFACIGTGERSTGRTASVTPKADVNNNVSELQHGSNTVPTSCQNSIFTLSSHHSSSPTPTSNHSLESILTSTQNSSSISIFCDESNPPPATPQNSSSIASSLHSSSSISTSCDNSNVTPTSSYESSSIPAASDSSNFTPTSTHNCSSTPTSTHNSNSNLTFSEASCDLTLESIQSSNSSSVDEAGDQRGAAYSLRPRRRICWSEKSPSKKSRRCDQPTAPKVHQNSDRSLHDPRSPHVKRLSPYRRKDANARERQRMKHINGAFEALRRALPHPGSSLTKRATLQRAVAYIRALDRLLQEPPDTALNRILNETPDPALNRFLQESSKPSLENIFQDLPVESIWKPESPFFHHEESIQSSPMEEGEMQEYFIEDGSQNARPGTLQQSSNESCLVSAGSQLFDMEPVPDERANEPSLPRHHFEVADDCQHAQNYQCTYTFLDNAIKTSISSTLTNSSVQSNESVLHRRIMVSR